MEKIIKAALARGASDLHIKAGDVFRARIDGELRPLTKQRLTPEQTKTIALNLISVEEDRLAIDRIQDYDCSWGAPGVGRFRDNILRQRSSFMIIMRVIPFEVPTLEKLTLPRSLETIALAERGLVLVTGAAGSGRSSTVAALLNHVNMHLNEHIVTIENPIEFLHRDIKSSVTQREIGSDTSGFDVGISAAVRQDSNVIMTSELPNAATVDAALNAAETGQLLISTLHTSDTMSSLKAVEAMFPPEQHEVVRIRLADTLRAVVSQRLLPRADEEGRCVAVEVMICTDEIRELIKNPERHREIRELIARGRDTLGMQTMDQHLIDLVESDVVDFETALAAAQDTTAFQRAFPARSQELAESAESA